jgi:2'-hydroxyisoflavone reductase
MKLLVLGGTKFLGRSVVETALANGHDVTLFNRGRTNPDLFPEAEKIRGDREQDLAPLAGRSWDAAIDMATFLPRVVRLSVDALREAVNRYVYVSSISVYADMSTPPVEGAAVATLDDPSSESIEDYGALKAACEQIVSDAFGPRALVVRPGLIVGPHDPTDRFTYWPRRIARGGEVLAPAPPDAPVQFIDVRDLGAWIVHATEQDLSGTYNATALPTTFAELIETCRSVARSDARITWVAPDVLLEAGVGEWMELPLWLASPEFAAMQQADVSSARAAGLTFRPLEETVRDTLAWDEARDEAPASGVGLAPERERELLGRA